MTIRFLRAAHKYIQKCDHALYKKIQKEIDVLLEDPYKNPPLKGALRSVRSHHFYFKRNQYRIAYRIEGDVIVILIASRENFYEKLEKMMT